MFVSYQDGLSRPVKPALLMMFGAVGMLLLIACANTANLLLARASGRGREISVRAALGAGRGRIIRQLLTESVILFVAGGLLGVALAYWAVPALLALTPPGYLPFETVQVDGIVLIATLALSVATGILFGLAPALSLSRQDLVEAFKDDGTRTTMNRRSGWLRHGLVVTEVALCMLLLVGSGLFIKTFVKLRSVDPGFDIHNVLTARMSLLGDRYATSADVNRLFDLSVERIRRIPGVQDAAVVNGVPIERGLNVNFDYLDTARVEAELTDWRYATTDYFKTMGIEIVKGRGFLESDRAGAPRIAVVSEGFAKRLMKGSAIGRRIQVLPSDGPIEIVGVAKDNSGPLLGRIGPPVMYVPVAQASDAAIRTSHQVLSGELGRPCHASDTGAGAADPGGVPGRGADAAGHGVAQHGGREGVGHGKRSVPDDAAVDFRRDWSVAGSSRDLRLDRILGGPTHARVRDTDGARCDPRPDTFIGHPTGSPARVRRCRRRRGCGDVSYSHAPAVHLRREHAGCDDVCGRRPASPAGRAHREQRPCSPGGSAESGVGIARRIGESSVASRQSSVGVVSRSRQSESSVGIVSRSRQSESSVGVVSRPGGLPWIAPEDVAYRGKGTGACAVDPPRANGLPSDMNDDRTEYRSMPRR